MFQKNKLLRALLTAGLTTGLVACGGGSSGGDSETPPSSNPPAGPELTGQFVDSPVGGLEYSRSNKGNKIYLTNDNGEFQYQDGETVTFKIGQLTLAAIFNPVVQMTEFKRPVYCAQLPAIFQG